jgi:hypothetical protein
MPLERLSTPAIDFAGVLFCSAPELSFGEWLSTQIDDYTEIASIVTYPLA